MPQKRDPFATALAAIRRELTSGQHGSGAPLSISDLARQLGLSPTPIREALAHLAGEGLVEERRGQGFFSPHLDAEQLTELFDLHCLYVGAALTAPWPASLDPVECQAAVLLARADPSEAAWRLFERLVGRTRNDTLCAAHRRIAERLAPVWRAKARLDLGDAEVVAAMARTLDLGDQAQLAGSLESYYDQCRRSAPALVRLLRPPRPREYIPDIV